MSGIRMFVLDVDGTMTDGRIYMGPAGKLFKACLGTASFR